MTTDDRTAIAPAPTERHMEAALEEDMRMDEAVIVLPTEAASVDEAVEEDASNSVHKGDVQDEAQEGEEEPMREEEPREDEEVPKMDVDNVEVTINEAVGVVEEECAATPSTDETAAPELEEAPACDEVLDAVAVGAEPEALVEASSAPEPLMTPAKTSTMASEASVDAVYSTPQAKGASPAFSGDISFDGPSHFDLNTPSADAKNLHEDAKTAFVKTPYKQPNAKLSYTSLELQAIKTRRAEIEKEKLRNEKYRLVAQKQSTHQMVERSTKPLTLPITPELLSTKRGALRCVGHDAAHPCTPECDRKAAFLTAEELVARPDRVSGIPHSKPLRRTSAHSPFLQTATRARRSDVAEASRADNSNGPISAADLVCRKPRAASPVRVLKRTVPASPFLATKHRAKKPRFDDKENMDPSTTVVTAEALVARPLHTKMTHDVAKKTITIAAAPHLMTMERATMQATYRKAVPPIDEDAIELAKQFHASPVPTSLHKPSKLKKTRRSPLATVQAKTPPLKSLERHAKYKADFEARTKQQLDDDDAKRVFKAQPMPIVSGPAPVIKSKTPLTVAAPFQCPGDIFHERHLERMQLLREKAEDDLRSQMRVKATPIVLSTHVGVAPSTKPLTEAKSPSLALKRRMVDRAAYDRKEQERRQRDEEARLLLAKEAARKEQEDLKAYRKNELTFRALKRRRTKAPTPDAS